MARYPTDFSEYIPEPTGQVVDINADNADEFAGIIGIPLAEFLKERAKLPIALPHQFVQLKPVPPPHP